MSKSSFLFVPYHAGSRKNSDARSHAAAVSRQRRGKTSPKYQRVLQKPATLKVVSAADTEVKNASDEEECDGHTNRSPTATKSTTGMVRGQCRQRMRAMQFSWRAGNCAADFNTSDSPPPTPCDFTESDGFGQRVIDYYKQVISPVNRAVYKIFNVTNLYTSYWMQLLQDEHYKPAGLALAGAVMERATWPDREPSEDVELNQATAVSRLQKSYHKALESGSGVADDIIIITVMTLASLARLLGDSQGYETYKNNLKLMVSLRGGLGALGHNGLAKCALLQWDSFWILETQETPLFSDARPERRAVYPAFPLSPDVRDMFVRLPVGFQSLVIKGRISVELIEVLSRTADAAESGIDSLGSESIHDSQIRRYSDFVEACPCLDSQTGESRLEKQICLGLLLFCSNAFTSARSSAALYVSCRMELSRMLSQNEIASFRLPERECLFWVCAICIDSWRKSGSDSPLLPQGESLLPILRTLRGDVTSENILQKFFCYDDLLSGCSRYLDMNG